MSFEHLQQSAERCFTDAEQYRATKPETSMACTSHGHEIRASYYLANNDPRFKDEIHALLVNELARYGQFGSSVRSFPQDKYAILALAISFIDLAKEILALPIDRKNWGNFDSYVTYQLCLILGIPQTAKAPTFSPTQAESSFISAIESLKNRADIDYQAVESFWKALRKKRYQLTIFEHANLFGDALRALEKTV